MQRGLVVTITVRPLLFITNMRNYLFLTAIVFLFINQNTIGQSDSLKLFTKQGCGNCKFAKETLNKNSASYIEYELEDRENVKQMFNYLHKIGYKGKILMPVMVLNNEVYHPVYQAKDTLLDISLSGAIDSILTRIKVKNLQLAHAKISIQTADDLQPTSQSDCETQITPIYLVCRNFKIKNEALIFLQELQSNGYTNAGILEHQGFYRVYNKYFLNQDFANDELKKTRITNGEAYLLSVN